MFLHCLFEDWGLKIKTLNGFVLGNEACCVKVIKRSVVDTWGEQGRNTLIHQVNFLWIPMSTQWTSREQKTSLLMCCSNEEDVRLPLSKPSKCPTCRRGCCKIYKVSEFLLSVLPVPGCRASPCWCCLGSHSTQDLPCCTLRAHRSSLLHSLSQCWAHGGGNPLSVLPVTTLGIFPPYYFLSFLPLLWKKWSWIIT